MKSTEFITENQSAILNDIDNTGYWKQHSHGTLKLVNIKTDDVKNLGL